MFYESNDAYRKKLECNHTDFLSYNENLLARIEQYIFLK